jgi:hypothetical protein
VIRVSRRSHLLSTERSWPPLSSALVRKLDELERQLKGHDEVITAILSAIRDLMSPPTQQRRGIGFTADLE